jgi:hypothetical protein
MREVQRFVCGGALLLVAACEGGTRPDPSVPTALSPVSAATQSGTVGSAALAPPVVRVLDQRSQPMAGVAVTFAVTAGGGSVSAASATTGASGNASAGAWTLGTVAGTNTVTATAGSLQTAFTATAGAAELVALQKVGGDNQSAVVGTALADSLAVRAVDAFGNPVPDQSVTFGVTSGGGTLSAGAATTSAAGTAKVRLTLGTTPGPNSVTATARGVSALFTATASAGPPATLTKAAGDNQSATPGSLLPVRPAVRVADSFGNPIAGVAVTFAVTGGGGSVIPGVAGTDAAGLASVGWTLGPAFGTNTLSATAASLPAVTFTATAQQNQDPCAVSVPHEFGTSTQGQLDPADCQLDDGSRLDYYTLDLATASNFRVSMTSTAFNAFLFLADASGEFVAADDDGGEGTDAVMHVLAPAGRYFIVANSAVGNVFGSYTVSTSAGGSVTNCVGAFIVPGIATTQALQSTDCLSSGYYYDDYAVVLSAGQTITIQQSSGAFDTYLELYHSSSGALIAADDDGGGGTNSRIVYTAPATDVYIIVPSSWDTGILGSYTLSVQ